MESLVRGPGLVAGELCDAYGVVCDGGRWDALIEVWVMQTGYEAQVNQGGVDQFVQVARATAKAVEGFSSAAKTRPSLHRGLLVEV